MVLANTASQSHSRLQCLSQILLLHVCSPLLQVVKLKGHPTFVSDALSKDLQWMVSHLAALTDPQHASVQKVGVRWQQYLDNGQWLLQDDLFWAQPRPYWEVR